MTSMAQYTEPPLSGQATFRPLPAVALGGPPHSGKSVLAYSLTQALRRMKILHYLLRAYPPDYEGDWFLSEAPWVRRFRVKAAGSEVWLSPLKRDVAQRHLPLLVDMGGLPTSEQEGVLDACTHAVLLTRDAASHTKWEERMARHGLVVLADLKSELNGANAVTAVEPVLRGTLSGLERGKCAQGPAFEALVAVLARMFRRNTEGIRRYHLETAPVELAVDLETLAAKLGVDAVAWPPEMLPQVLDYLPEGQPLALYGRGPNWLYAAVAAHALPGPFHLFDVRWGWVETPILKRGAIAPDAPLQLAFSASEAQEAVVLTFTLPDHYLDLEMSSTLTIPDCPPQGVILSGKLPHWLWAALARGCDAPWLAVLQPQLRGAVVVRSTDTSRYPPGMVVSVE